jgi:hypothetical protein
VNGSPRWIRFLATSCWLIGLVAVASGPAPYVWRPSLHDTWLWPATDTTTMDDTYATVDSAHAGTDGADVVVLDPFLAAEQTVSNLHSRSRAAVCRLHAGIWEAGRPDEARLDPNLVGGGRWLDIREWEPLATVFADRFALCVTKGFDGVVFTDLDGYAHPTGFPLTAADQYRFNAAVVSLAHRSGLTVAVVATAWTPMPADADVIVTRPR